MPVRWEVVSVPVSRHSLYTATKSGPSRSQKCAKNYIGKPSIPGDLLCAICRMAAVVSCKLMLPSHEAEVQWQFSFQWIKKELLFNRVKLILVK